jgi:dTDP-4-dehydrorhamnose reductase
MKILITGARGQLGRDCTRLLEPDHAVTPLDLPELDIAETGQVRAVMEQLRPDVVLNCAAYTRVDDCEDHREDAWRVNAIGPAVLAAAAGGARLIQISTDYVFDGQRPVPGCYTEDDPVRPLSCYGQSKLAGEEAVRTGCRHWAILRTAWLYGRHGGNFPKTMLRLSLRQPEKVLRVVNGQYGSPTWSWRLAEQLRTVIEAGATGLFHATAEGHTTWYEFAARILAAMHVPHNLQPCRNEEYPTRAIRPVNSILENSALKQAGLNVMRPWQEDLEEFVARHREELLAECR